MKKKYRHIGQKVLIRENFKMGNIVRKIDDKKYLTSFYDSSGKLKYIIITENDIINEDEYEKIKLRINKINEIIGN